MNKLVALLAAAAQLPDVRFRIGGVGPLHDALKAVAPGNVEFVGMLDKPGLAADPFRFLTGGGDWEHAWSFSEGDPLAASVVTGPAHGALALSADGSFEYRPAKDYASTRFSSLTEIDAQNVGNLRGRYEAQGGAGAVDEA